MGRGSGLGPAPALTSRGWRRRPVSQSAEGARAPGPVVGARGGEVEADGARWAQERLPARVADRLLWRSPPASVSGWWHGAGTPGNPLASSVRGAWG